MTDLLQSEAQPFSKALEGEMKGAILPLQERPSDENDSGQISSAAAPLTKKPKLSPSPAAPTAHVTPNPEAAAALPPLTSPSPIQKASRRSFAPLSALNPYNNQMTVKAKVDRKAPKRSITMRGEAASVLTIELLDKEGGRMEGTFWREAADKYDTDLVEGRVYFFTKFNVKPTNRRYSAVDADYGIHFNANTTVEEAEDQAEATVEAKLKIARIDTLQNYIERRMNVDLLGVVTAAEALSSVKRKTDGTELIKREITLTDDSCKTVTLTLWGTNAEAVGGELQAAVAGGDRPVLSISSCRVSDYNGISVSSLARSVVRINPTGPGPDALRRWWADTGSQMELVHAGEGMARRQSGGTPAARTTLAALSPAAADMPSPDAKPVWSKLTLTVAQVNPDQTMYYCACKENGRKVMPLDGRYLCEYDGNVYDEMERRYVLNVKAIDHTGEGYLNMFNDVGPLVMGCSADAASELKENPEREEELRALCAEASWREYYVDVSSRSREYNGATKMRLTAHRMYPLDYSKECSNLLTQIELLRSKRTAAA